MVARILTKRQISCTRNKTKGLNRCLAQKVRDSFNNCQLFVVPLIETMKATY